MSNQLTVDPDFTSEITSEFKTIVNLFENGTEQRRQKWGAKRGQWKLTYKNKSSADYGTVKTLYEACCGQAIPFEWLCPLDNTTYTVRFMADTFAATYDAYGIYNFSFQLIEVK
jgi:hypothetical protein